MKRLAIYDNPEFLRREVYRDGRRVTILTAEQIADDECVPADLAHPFKPGRLVGDRRALRPYRPVRSAAVKPWGAV